MTWRPLALAAAGLAMAACHDGVRWQDKLIADKLYARANALSRAESCSRLVPMEYGRTIPVPSAAPGRFKVLFYPSTVNAGKSSVATPGYSGDFELDSSTQDMCAALPPSATVGLGPALSSSLSAADYYRLQFELYTSLELASSLYFKGRPLGDEDKRTVSAFAASFERLAEPGLLPYYYQLNPDFWSWLHREGAAASPGPAGS